MRVGLLGGIADVYQPSLPPRSARTYGVSPVGELMVARPNPVDIHVGARVRLRRTLLGLSQEQLGARLGLTFQQVQKYERGANRIGAGRLYLLSQILGIPVSFFFDALPDGEEKRLARGPAGTSPAPPVGAAEADTMSRRETMELVRAYYRIRDPDIRASLAEMIKTIAGAPPGAKRRGRPPKA